jgi:hypothetical protein
MIAAFYGETRLSFVQLLGIAVPLRFTLARETRTHRLQIFYFF